MKQVEIDPFQEELAKTYFAKDIVKEADPKATPPQPIRKKTGKIKHFFLAAAGMIALIAVLFIFNKVEIQVKISPTSKLKPPEAAVESKRIYLNKDGDFNRSIISNAIFYENATSESKWENGLVTLANETGSKKAVFGIDFTVSVNMLENSFCFYAKGKGGGEIIRISLKDIRNDICHSKIHKLQNSWQQFLIEIDGPLDNVDLNKITHIDFEINPNEEGILNPLTVYLKDMYIEKRGG